MDQDREEKDFKSDSRSFPLEKIRERLFRMVSVGVIDDPINSGYDIISTGALIINLIVSFMVTFDKLASVYGDLFHRIEAVTVAFFALDFCLRLFTAHNLYPDRSEKRAVLSYVFSASGIIDIMSFLPYYLPFFFPSGAAVSRMFRIARIFRLFRINAYYDSLNVITEVLYSKKQQLLSSFFILSILMMSSSLCMYSLEHEAQPEVYENAFSGIWWSVSTLLTVGYGDIYPVTPGGRFMGIVIAFLGVGMVAIPTGIISAGFVEQYSRLKRMGDYAEEEGIQFIEAMLSAGDPWCGRSVRSLELPKGLYICAVLRGSQTMVPGGDMILKPDDRMIIGASSIRGNRNRYMDLKEVTLKKNHQWVGVRIQDLDISRLSFIVMVKRGKNNLLPQGRLVLRENDAVLIFSKHRQKEEEE